MDHDVQEEAERIDEDVPLAARDLLARIPRVRPLAGPRTGSALRVDRRPPFCAALALWLSMTAADGLASRPTNTSARSGQKSPNDSRSILSIKCRD